MILVLKEGRTVPKMYLLPCSCGESIPLETAQAGQAVVCQACGKSLQAPSLLNLKKLPTIEKETPFEAYSGTLPTGSLRLAFQTLGALVLVLSLVFLGWVITTRPKPVDVIKKRTMLTYGSSSVYQNSTPLPENEHRILRFHESNVDYMSPMELVIYFRMLKCGPVLSDNFQENYRMLKDAYHIRLGASFVGVGVGILLLVLSLIMPKRPQDVAVRKGSEWS